MLVLLFCFLFLVKYHLKDYLYISFEGETYELNLNLTFYIRSASEQNV